MATAQAPDAAEAPERPKLTPKAQARMYEIKARNAMVQAIAGESWGAKLTPIQQRAFAEYMRRFHLDISEIDNLGGRPYRNGRYYMRRIAELAAQDRVEWYKGDHIGPNAELALLAAKGDEWAVQEQTRRMRERIRHEVPSDATFAYVVTVKMKELALPTEGCKYYVPGRKKMGWRDGRKVEVDADPVGDENPVTSVETRAWRRCGRLAAAEIPELRDQEAEMEFAASETQAAVIAEAVRADTIDADAEITPRPIDTDTYENDPPRGITEGPARPIVTRTIYPPTPEQREQIRANAARFADTPDPYGFDDSPTPFDGPIVYPEAYTCPEKSCGRTVAKSNEHSADCPSFIE